MIENIFPSRVPNFIMRNRMPQYYPTHMLYAFLEVGVKETRPKGFNPRISEYFKSINLNLHENTSWCGAALAYIMQKAYLLKRLPPGACRSQWWLSWGITSVNPLSGDIVVFSDRENPTKGHVGIYIKETKKSILVLGGNQGDKFCYMWYKKQGKKLRLANYRRTI